MVTHFGRVFVLTVFIILAVFDLRAAATATADAGFQLLSTTAVSVSEPVDNNGVSGGHSSIAAPGQNVVDNNQGSNSIDTTVVPDLPGADIGTSHVTPETRPKILEAHGTQEDAPNPNGPQNQGENANDAAMSNAQAAVHTGINSNPTDPPAITKTSPSPTNTDIATSDNIVYAQTNTNQQFQPTSSSASSVSDTTVVPDTDLSAVSGTPAPPSDGVGVQGEQAPPTGTSADVDPLGIFVDDIKYQRFPEPMPLETFKSKVLNRSLKKLYILEENKFRLFQNVRQVAVFYQLVNETLYATLQFRSIHYRQCRLVPNFKIGALGKDKSVAAFEKSLPNDAMERVFFFSENPDEYVYIMSCTDMNASPYACRDTYYLTLDTTRDPPNRFPWLQASLELKGKMNITFDDPRFMFNMVMMPCLKMAGPTPN